MNKDQHAQAAARIDGVIADLENFLPGKVRAYGAAHEVQPQLWNILLAPYRDGSGYRLPSHIVREIPRLTRCLDRILRIVNAPDEGDIHGEHPWLDLAGDAIAGEATRRALLAANERMSTGPRLSNDVRFTDAALAAEAVPCGKLPDATLHLPTAGGCELLAGHQGRHEAAYAPTQGRARDDGARYRWDATGAELVQGE